jgi:hypothetical protein
MTIKEASASDLSTEESRIIAAADEIRGMTNDVREDSARGPEPLTRKLAERLRQLTVEAPLQSLLIAFLVGVLIARRR